MNDKYFPLETPFGRVWLLPTEKDHIYASGGSNLNVEKEYPEGTRMGPIQINRVDYAFSGHFYLWSDGKWHFGTEDGKQSPWGSCYLTRTGSYYKDGVSGSARAKAQDVFPTLVTEWAKEHRQEILAAEVSRQEARVVDAREKAKEASRLAQEAWAKLEAAKQELKSAVLERSVA